MIIEKQTKERPVAREMTPSQKLAYKFIKEYTAGSSPRSPSLKEIAEKHGKTIAWAQGILTTLIKNGHVTHDPGVQRSFRIVETNEA